jgi:hypothetical protein
VAGEAERIFITLGPAFFVLMLLYFFESLRSPVSASPVVFFVALSLLLQSVLMTYHPKFSDRNRAFSARLSKSILMRKIVSSRSNLYGLGVVILMPAIFGSIFVLLLFLSGWISSQPIFLGGFFVVASLMNSPFHIFLFECKFKEFFVKSSILLLLPLSGLAFFVSAIQAGIVPFSAHLSTPLICWVFLNARSFGVYSVCFGDKDSWGLVASALSALIIAAAQSAPYILEALKGVGG